MRKALSLTLALVACAITAAPAAAARPCELPAPERPPSAQLLGPLGVLRSPATRDDRAPRDVRDGDGRPYADAMRKVPLAIGGWVWVVPLFDVSDRVTITDACIRAAPRRIRPEMRRLKRQSRGIARVEGLQLLPYDAAGDSHGVVAGSIVHVLEGSMVHIDGADEDRRTRVVGLVLDGVASVRVALAASGGKRTVETTTPVAENVFAVELDTRFTATDPTVTFLDAAGAVVGPRRDG